MIKDTNKDTHSIDCTDLHALKKRLVKLSIKPSHRIP